MKTNVYFFFFFLMRSSFAKTNTFKIILGAASVPSLPGIGETY